METPIVTLYGS